MKSLILFVFASLLSSFAYANETEIVATCESDDYKVEITSMDETYQTLILQKNKSDEWEPLYSAPVEKTTTRGMSLLFTNDEFGLSVVTESTLPRSGHLGTLRLWLNDLLVDEQTTCYL